MLRHIKYLKYVVVHRWFVFLECCKYGIPWLGIIHDISKFRPDEWFPYANFFYGKNIVIRDNTGYYKPTDTGNKRFDFAWLLHQKRNKHHLQWWILPEDEGKLKVLPIPIKYCKEMLCDWIGAGKAQESSSVSCWYNKNSYKMTLHRETRLWIENQIEKRDLVG